MSLYRQAGGRRAGVLLAAALAALVIGFAGGFAAGRASAPEPDLAERVAELQASVEPALSALELVSIEYPQAVVDGRVAAETEYAAVRSQLDAARASLDGAASDLALLDRAALERARDRLERLDAAVQVREKRSVVDRAAAAAAAAIEAATGTSG